MATGRLSVINGLVFDGVNSEPIERPVHTSDGRIVGLDGRPTEGARVIDAGGRLVTPGLIDAHFHAYTVSLDLLEMEALPMSYVAAKAARRLQAALRRGFTTLRDVAGGDIGLRMALDEGLIDGPRLPVHRSGPDPDRRSRRPQTRPPRHRHPGTPLR